MNEGKGSVRQVVIIGGGAAGMLCGILTAGRGCRVTLLEQNEKLGKKLFITGKGRCNFTNACTPEEFRSNVVTNPRFLYSASEAMTSEDVIRLFESYGLRTKVERGRRAFPLSDHASDVIDMLAGQLKRQGVRVFLGTRVTGILTRDREAVGVTCISDGKTMTLRADAVVLATGGLSYPSTGSTGDGYRFAKELGLKVTDLYPSLVPISCREEILRELQGLSLKNVELSVRSGKKVLFREFGEMLFTHFGVSGPLVLSASSRIGPLIGKRELTSRIDLKPAVTIEQLHSRFLKLYAENPKKALKNVLHELYPAKLLPVVPALAGVDPEKRCCEVSQGEREALVQVTKAFPLTFSSLRGYNEAVVTKGGIEVKEINPKTMESRSCRGLYCIGEVLDLDAYTGGYNLQIAWCTAAACARALGEDSE